MNFGPIIQYLKYFSFGNSFFLPKIFIYTPSIAVSPLECVWSNYLNRFNYGEMRLFLFYFSFMLARPVASPGSVLIDSQVKMLILVSLFFDSLRAKILEWGIFFGLNSICTLFKTPFHRNFEQNKMIFCIGALRVELHLDITMKTKNNTIQLYNCVIEGSVVTMSHVIRSWTSHTNVKWPPSMCVWCSSPVCWTERKKNKTSFILKWYLTPVMCKCYHWCI